MHAKRSVAQRRDRPAIRRTASRSDDHPPKQSRVPAVRRTRQNLSDSRTSFRSTGGAEALGPVRPSCRTVGQLSVGRAEGPGPGHDLQYLSDSRTGFCCSGRRRPRLLVTDFQSCRTVGQVSGAQVAAAIGPVRPTCRTVGQVSAARLDQVALSPRCIQTCRTVGQRFPLREWGGGPHRRSSQLVGQSDRFVRGPLAGSPGGAGASP